jgi:hypothetical protein
MSKRDPVQGAHYFAECYARRGGEFGFVSAIISDLANHLEISHCHIMKLNRRIEELEAQLFEVEMWREFEALVSTPLDPS